MNYLHPDPLLASDSLPVDYRRNVCNRDLAIDLCSLAPFFDDGFLLPLCRLVGAMRYSRTLRLRSTRDLRVSDRGCLGQPGPLATLVGVVVEMDGPPLCFQLFDRRRIVASFRLPDIVGQSFKLVIFDRHILCVRERMCVCVCVCSASEAKQSV